MNDTILRSEVINKADAGEAFDMEFITADRKRGTGGDLIKVIQWKKVTSEKKQAPTSGPAKVNNSRKPLHEVNKTMNIFNPKNAGVHIHKVHFRLIQMFNGKRVVNG